MGEEITERNLAISLGVMDFNPWIHIASKSPGQWCRDGEECLSALITLESPFRIQEAGRPYGREA